MRAKTAISRLAAVLIWRLRLVIGTRERTQAAALPNRAKALRRDIAATVAPSDPGMELSMWTAVRKELRQRLSKSDLTRFLSWEPVRRTLVISDFAYVRSVLGALKASDEWRPRWRPVLREDYVGLPQPSLASPGSSGTLIHHAGLIHAYEQHSGRHIESLSRIVEFGGGYGSMLRLICRLGFCGSYHIHDFPELTALQLLFYDLTVGADAVPPSARERRRPTFSHRIADLPTDGGRVGDSAFLATWSLGETLARSREAWRPIMNQFQHFLFGYREQFDGQDNAAWFAQFREERPEIIWREIRPAKLPGQVVLVGAPRSADR